MISDLPTLEEDRVMRKINLPNKYKLKDNGEGKITMQVPKKTDLWRTTRHGYVKENAPYYFRKVTGDFQVTVKVSADFLDMYDQAGILIRENKRIYMKCGIEVFRHCNKNICHASTCVTREATDWSTMPLPGEGTKEFWFVVKRLGNCVEAYCSADGTTYNQIRLAQLSDTKRLSVGMYGACPQGSGLKVTFDNFEIIEEDDEETDEEEDEEDDTDRTDGDDHQPFADDDDDDDDVDDDDDNNSLSADDLSSNDENNTSSRSSNNRRDVHAFLPDTSEQSEFFVYEEDYSDDDVYE